MSAIIDTKVNPQDQGDVASLDKAKTIDMQKTNIVNDPAAFYLTLPDLEEAIKSLLTVNFDDVLAKVTDLLVPYEDKFGLSLVHRHFPIFPNELMVEDGPVMKPFAKDANTEFFEKRWDRYGRPYEYSTTRQAPIPEKLLRDFQALIPDSTYLGLYSRVGDDETQQWMETTHPDKRLHLNVPKTDEYADAPETAWYSKDGAPLTRGCGSICVPSKTIRGTTFNHVKHTHPNGL
ncbi:hypothetical protein I302_107089 [Kwoniella bestiolae CBS 10118]|uniref:Uncharacterized protein n=1 Tax=Kwoniella bestiolae CBS 10118 TaxID=1296100 RepID=A0A1B9FZI9_9TREE|nr:hypothetical protein I302_05646 [Kwoniella bestiolae CBS 10118]OCF24187.1 hypothetical protein I302_05646 [Kwoniella bestiolae CBS 10118]